MKDSKCKETYLRSIITNDVSNLGIITNQEYPELVAGIKKFYETFDPSNLPFVDCIEDDQAWQNGDNYYFVIAIRLKIPKGVCDTEEYDRFVKQEQKEPENKPQKPHKRNKYQ